MKENENDLLGLMDESLITPRSTRFKSSYTKDDEEDKTEPSGETSIDIFIDRVNPFNKTAHPALPNVLKQISSIRKKRGSPTATSIVSQAPAIYMIVGSTGVRSSMRRHLMSPNPGCILTFTLLTELFHRFDRLGIHIRANRQ